MHVYIQISEPFIGRLRYNYLRTQFNWDGKVMYAVNKDNCFGRAYKSCNVVALLSNFVACIDVEFPRKPTPKSSE